MTTSRPAVLPTRTRSPRWRRRLAPPLVAGAIVLAPAGVFAQGSAPAAEALFEQGRRDMARGEYDLACQEFRDSDQLDPGVGAKLNLANCEERRGRLATAWELFTRVEAELDPTDERRALARERRQDLEPRVPRLILVLAKDAPSGTVAELDGAELGASGFGVPLPVDPGAHRLIVSAPNRSDRTVEVALRVGQRMTVAVSPGQATAAPTSEGLPVVPEVTETPVVGRPRRQHTAKRGYAIGSVGAAGLVLGSVAGLVVLDKKRTAEKHCDSETRTCDQAGVDANRVGPRWAVASTIGFAVGAAGLGIGTYLVLTSDSAARTKTVLAAGGGPAGGYVTVDWQF
ncbi:MAG: hypothetical protein JW751_00445 [Polyangiaceae bacterium]|nr:hypothetical protein [Polyangiaceae bacterium]